MRNSIKNVVLSSRKRLINNATVFDAGDTSSIVLNGSTVSQWRTNNTFLATQSTTANQPTYNAVGLNGKPILDFDGTNDHLTLNANLAITTQNFNVFAVARGGSSTAFCKSLILGSADGFLLNLRSASQIRNVAGTAYSIPNINADDSFGIYAFICSTSDSTLQVEVFYNGVLASSSTFSGTGYNINYTPYIARGDGGAGTTTSFAKIAKLAIMLSSVSSTTRQEIEGILAWEWGLQSLLPDNHPFKYTLP